MIGNLLSFASVMKSIGGVLLAAAITVTIIMNCIENKKEETRVCSVPNAEVF